MLLIVAHPDDDVVIGGYLARASLDQHKRIAVIYCTNGDGGGNSVGYEAGAALGQMRIQEARHALQFLHIKNAWFLGQHDNPGQNVLWSLGRWHHGEVLEDVVRLIRLTRPDVILTWLPDHVVGEDHDDHQAAGVIATEAFDLAGDPLAFPAQVSAPRNRTGMGNLTEGLHPWQPKKIYYFTDAFEDFGPYWHDPRVASPFRKSIVDGTGPVFSQTEISPSRHVSYAKLTAEHQRFYMTQEGDFGVRALAKSDFREFNYPTYLIFGKSLVGGSVTGDVFEGVTPRPIPFSPPHGYHDIGNAPKLSVELGGPWAFYREFWKAHDLPNIAKLLPAPEIAVGFGGTLHIPLLISNATRKAEVVELDCELPAGWSGGTKFAQYPVKPGETYPVEVEIVAPKTGKHEWRQIRWKAEAKGRSIGSVTLRVYLGTSGMPQ
jgi:LmbE family N-acetylglucosaminyl deacetylase